VPATNEAGEVKLTVTVEGFGSAGTEEMLTDVDAIVDPFGTPAVTPWITTLRLVAVPDLAKGISSRLRSPVTPAVKTCPCSLVEFTHPTAVIAPGGIVFWSCVTAANAVGATPVEIPKRASAVREAAKSREFFMLRRMKLQISRVNLRLTCTYLG
jgi:hypothetical protein